MKVTEKILLVDDEPDLIEMLKWQLEKHVSKVYTALSGEEALDILQQEALDIVISDIRMPGMDGIELVKRVKKLRKNAQCIFITGHGDKETAVAAFELGAFFYLPKPLSIDTLVLVILKAQEKLELIRGNPKEIRISIFDVMNFALRYWELISGKTKVHLAEESRIWAVALDDHGNYRTRTLDRYLRIATMPKNPNINKVLNTCDFILAKCPSDYPDLEAQLREKKNALDLAQRELEITRSF
jgi:YesN/AraC family two-component response regulator